MPDVNIVRFPSQLLTANLGYATILGLVLGRSWLMFIYGPVILPPAYVHIPTLLLVFNIILAMLLYRKVDCEPRTQS